MSLKSRFRCSVLLESPEGALSLCEPAAVSGEVARRWVGDCHRQSPISAISVAIRIYFVFEEKSFERVAFAGGSAAILLILFAQFLSSVVDEFIPPLFKSMDEKTSLDLSTLKTITVSATKLLAWVAAVLIALDQLNVDITAIVASATILTLVIGLALQETAANLVSGLLMLLDKPFSKGDKVIVMGVKGRVHDVGLMTTKIKTGNESEVKSDFCLKSV